MPIPHKTIDQPAELLQRLNDETLATASRGLFVTMVAGVYDATKGRVAFANAGHEPPLLRTPDHRYETFAADAPPLGILPELGYEQESDRLEPGDLIAVYSDGVTEAIDLEGEEFGQDRLAELLVAKRDETAETIVEAVNQALDEWTSSAPAGDDVTLVVARRLA